MKEFNKQYFGYRKEGYTPLFSAKLARAGIETGLGLEEGLSLMEALTDVSI